LKNRSCITPEPASENLPVSRTARTHRSGWFRAAVVLLVSVAAVSLAACGPYYYKFPQYNFAGRPIPPSKLAQRVMVALTSNGSSGALQILDAKRDIRSNVENTIPAFAISGYSGGFPSRIDSFPEQLTGLVYSNLPPYPVTIVNYGTERATTALGQFPAPVSSFSVAPSFSRLVAAVPSTGQIAVQDSSIPGSYALNLPNVQTVAVDRGNTLALATVRNSDALYRLIRLNTNQPPPPGNVDCQPTVLPVFCIVPVPGTFDRPTSVVFSADGANAYILNCGQECGGGGNGGAGISIIPLGALDYNAIPTSLPYPPVVSGHVSVPHGVTAGLTDGTHLYVAGQQLQPDGLFAGFLSTIDLANLTVGAPVSISDGYHSKMLFADDNTLWIGSQFCATGERAKLNENYNCLSRYDLGSGVASIVPAIIPATSTSPATVPYPNADQNLLYLGSLTGLTPVQTFHKVYTAYGGQVHAFKTTDGSEINNQFIAVQGTALDVTYMDASTNAAEGNSNF